MKKRYIVPVFLVCALTASLRAQDYHFSLYSETPAAISPALAGVRYNTRVVVNYKSQWSSVANKYETMAASFEQTIKHKKLKNNYFAVSANIYRDVAGDAKLSTLNPNLGVSYHQKISKVMKLSAGLQSGFFFKTIDASNLRYDRQYDGYSYNSSLSSGEAPPRSGFASFDLGGGVNLHFNEGEKFISAKDGSVFDIGVSAYHYQIGKNSFLNSAEKLQTRYCGYFSGDFAVPNSKNAIMPSFLYMRQGTSSEFIAGALFKFLLGDASTYTPLKTNRSIAVGGYYRFKDAIIPTVLMQINKYAIGLAYDINVSALTPASKRQGGFEVMLRYNIAPGYGVNLGRSDTKPSY